MKRAAPPAEVGPARPPKAAKLTQNDDVTSSTSNGTSENSKEVEILTHIARTGCLHSSCSWDKTRQIMCKKLENMVENRPLTQTEPFPVHHSVGSSTNQVEEIDGPIYGPKWLKYLPSNGDGVENIPWALKRENLRLRCDKEAIVKRVYEIQERLKRFPHAPFTIQRMCELLIQGFRYYATKDTFLHAMAKLVRGISVLHRADTVTTEPKVGPTPGSSTIPSSNILSTTTRSPPHTQSSSQLRLDHRSGEFTAAAVFRKDCSNAYSSEEKNHNENEKSETKPGESENTPPARRAAGETPAARAPAPTIDHVMISSPTLVSPEKTKADTPRPAVKSVARILPHTPIAAATDKMAIDDGPDKVVPLPPISEETPPAAPPAVLEEAAAPIFFFPPVPEEVAPAPQESSDEEAVKPDAKPDPKPDAMEVDADDTTLPTTLPAAQPTLLPAAELALPAAETTLPAKIEKNPPTATAV